MPELVMPAPSEAWTFQDLANLPEDGRRYEIVDGGLLVSPVPGSLHQVWAARLQRQLHSAAPPELEVVHNINVDLGRSVFIPDVAVVVADVALADTPIFKPADVTLVVEIESPSSIGMDRILKLARYAECGIPSYWRIDPGRNSSSSMIVVYELVGDQYREVAVIKTGERLQVERPFPVVFDPAQLVP